MKTLARTSLALVAFLGIAAVTAVGPAWAQPGPGFGESPGMMGGGPGMMRGDPQQRWEQMQQRHAQRMQELEKQLNLKPDQQAAWQGFIKAHNDWIQSMQTGWQSWRGATNTPDRFDRMVDSMQKNLSKLQDLDQQAHALYKTLDPQQQATLDRFTARPGRLKGKGQNQ